MFDKYDYMRERFPRRFGRLYADHLMELFNKNNRLDRKAVSRSIEAYFKSQQREFWESMGRYCEKNRVPWQEGIIALKMKERFDGIFKDKMKYRDRSWGTRRINEIFASPEKLAKALGRTYVAPEPVVEPKRPTAPVEEYIPTSRGFLSSQPGFWEDWDYD